MPRRSSVPYSLVRKRIRPSFKKINVYNAVTWRKNPQRPTQYRQVFFAKQELRSYHGENLTETQFRNIFRPENTSVSPLQQKADDQGEIPYAMQTFTALERRLDSAVFRSMFASSIRQAAQFVVGGAVKVNGVKIKSPGYVLRAGDVFSVDSNRVLEALGRVKPSKAQAVELTNRIIRKFNKYLDACRRNPRKMWKKREAMRRRHKVFAAKHEARKEARAAEVNKKLRSEMNDKIVTLKADSVLGSILSGNFKSASELLNGKAQQVLGLVRASAPNATREQELKEEKERIDPKTTSEQDLDADRSPVDPLGSWQKHPNPETSAEQDVDADNTSIDPLPNNMKASRIDSAPRSERERLEEQGRIQPRDYTEQEIDTEKKPSVGAAGSETAREVELTEEKDRIDPQTTAEQDVDANKSPVDPLPNSEKASRVDASAAHKDDGVDRRTSSEEVVDADNHPHDPLPDAEKTSARQEELEEEKEKIDPKTTAEEIVDADKSSVDPLPDAEKASREGSETTREQEISEEKKRSDPETTAEQDVDADNSPIDPLPNSEKASRVDASAHKQDDGVDRRTNSEELVDADNHPHDPLPDHKKASKDETAHEEEITEEKERIDPETTAEQDVDADKSPVDPLPDSEKASRVDASAHKQNDGVDRRTDSEELVDADNHHVDPLPNHKKASKDAHEEEVTEEKERIDPETTAEQDVDADKSPVDPLPDSEKASREDPETTAEQDVDADKSPVDPLPDSEKASRVDASASKKDNGVDRRTSSEELVDADNHPHDPLPSHKKASSDVNPRTDSEESVDADNHPVDPLHDDDKASSGVSESTGEEGNPKTDSEESVDGENHPVDPLPDSEKASRVGNTSASPASFFSDEQISEILSRFRSGHSAQRSGVKRLLDEITSGLRLEIRNDYTERMVDPKKREKYDPSWVDRLPAKIEEVEAEAEDASVPLPWSTTGKLYGLADPTKRWFTPWTPRQFTAPLAVLPHHIEVDFDTCHAVYLRDPVARPDQSEVISPFSLEMHERARMWYFYRRRKNLPQAR